MKKPTLATVMGSFSNLAGWRNWLDLEEFFNPAGAFERVHIVSVGDNHDYDRTRFGTLEIHPIRSLSSSARFRIPNAVYEMTLATRRLRKLTQRHQIDVIVQTYGGPLKFGLPAVKVARAAKIPSIISLHSDYRVSVPRTYPRLLQWASKLAWPYLFRRSAAIRSVSNHVASFAHAWGVPGEKVCVIPNKEDLAKFQAPPSAHELERVAAHYGLLGLRTDSVTFLTVGQLKEAKNLHGMLQAFARAARRQQNLYYVIAGEGPLGPELKALTWQLGLHERVRFIGLVPHESLRCIYHLADVLLFATHFEGQPRVVVEAMLAGLPIICSNHGQVCEIARHEQDGLWVNPADADEIAEAIIRLAADEEFRRKCSDHSDFEAEQYSIERVGAQEAELYLSVIPKASHVSWTSEPEALLE